MSSKNSKIKSIVSINAYENKFYALKGQRLKALNRLTYNSTNLTASYINSRDLISASIEISRSIPNEDLKDVIEIKAYEELGLDQAKEYIVKYTEGQSTGDVRVFDIFVVEPDVLHEIFDGIVAETKYIDLVVPAPLLYSAVYSKELIVSEGVHCFVYFGQKDTSVTFYKNGIFLYSKSIDYSFERIYDKYCELVGERVDENEFYNILASEGLKTIHADYQKNLMKLFGDIFIQINDIIIYAKRAFDFSRIDQMFIGSLKGPIMGLDEYSENYLGLQSSDLNFDFGIESDEWYSDQLQLMLIVLALEFMEDEDYVVNLTIFKRAPAFHKRASGQFIIATLLAISAGIAYPSYFLIQSYLNDATNIVLSNNEKQLRSEANKYKKILGAKKNEIKALDKKIAELSKVYHSKEKTLTSIFDKKVNYNLKSELLYNFANDIKHFDVNVDILSSDKNSFTISLLSKDEKEITKLIKYISEKHFDQINSIDIEKISKDPDDEYYNGILKVELQ